MRYIEKDIDNEVQNILDSSDNYNCEEAKYFIGHVYEHCCAYCEGRPEATSLPQIEHYYEKTDYPQFKTDLRNLHYTCQDCNMSKQHQKNKFRPILSPNFYLSCGGSGTDCGEICKKESTSIISLCNTPWKKTSRNFIASQLKYSGHLVFAKDKGSIAGNTIRCFDLNNEENRGRMARGSLVDDRLRVYCAFGRRIKIVYLCLVEIRNNPKDTYCLRQVVKTEMEQLMRDLKGRYQLPYTQMILDNYFVTKIQLLKIINHIKNQLAIEEW